MLVAPLRIVQGSQSDELSTLIVIRGIDNTQVRSATAKVNLTRDTIVSFLSIYAKPSKYVKVVDSRRQGQINHTVLNQIVSIAVKLVISVAILKDLW